LHLACPRSAAKSRQPLRCTPLPASALFNEVRERAPVNLWIGKPREAVVNCFRAEVQVELVSFSAPLGFLAGRKARRVVFLEQGKIIAVGQPTALFILLDQQDREKRTLIVRVVKSLPSLNPFIVGQEGRYRIVKGVDDAGVGSLPIRGPDVDAHSIRALSLVKGVDAANGEICVVVDDDVVIIVLQKYKAHGIIPCRLRPALPALLVVGDDFKLRTGRAQPRVTVFPTRPPGMRRRDLIGMN
jgi:hypothetical protein